MKKKIVSMVFSAALLATVLSGCGEKQETDNGKLIFWTNMQVEVDTLQELANEWGNANGVTVEVIHQSPSAQQFAQAVKSADGPDGVIGIPNDQLADYVNAGLAAETPNDLYNDDDFSSAAIQASYVDGKRVAVPLAVETISLFYNTDKVQTPAASWEELVENASAVGGIQFDATSIYYDLGFVRACGGYIFKYDSGKYDVNDVGLSNSGAVEAYTFINDLCKKYNYVSSDVTADIARSNFQNGVTAYYIGGPWDIDGFNSAGTHYEIAKMPSFKGADFATPVGTQVGFVSSKSSNQDKAWNCMMYVVEHGSEKMYASGKRIPAKKSEQQKQAIIEDKNAQAFIEQINVGEPMPTVSELGQLWGIHSNNIKSMWQGELDPKQTAENIANQLDEAVKLMNSGK